MLTVFIDPGVAPQQKRQDLIAKAISDLGMKCAFVHQRVEKTISWVTSPTAQASVASDIEEDVLAVLDADEAVSMIKAFHEENGQMTLTHWVESVQDGLIGKRLTVLIVGLDKYFNNLKLATKRKHKEAVSTQPRKGRKPKSNVNQTSNISPSDAEEVFVEIQLLTGCVVQHVDSDEELANEIKRFTKALVDKPSKKSRLHGVFSFLEEGAPGMNVSKSGEGLAKVWKHQLMQFKNLGADMAEAIVSQHPSPLLLYEACKNCTSPAEAESVIGDINVRRGAGVIATNRRIGKEQARRIHTFMTSSDSEQKLK